MNLAQADVSTTESIGAAVTTERSYVKKEECAPRRSKKAAYKQRRSKRDESCDEESEDECEDEEDYECCCYDECGNNVCKLSTAIGDYI